jgi:tetratricopeptide (TPR) repeat protein
VSIKGTLETFNLRELLQMLAFNQKDGTLVLETERGPRTVHLAGGRVGFVGGDRHASTALARVLRRHGLVPEDRLERALQIHGRTGRFLAEVLDELGASPESSHGQAWTEAVAETLFDLQMGKIRRFEFVEGRALAPDGSPGTPIEPLLQVDALLLELTRKVDTWGVLLETVPSLGEVFEGTGHEVDLSGVEDLDPAQAQRVVSHIDGYHDLDQVADASSVDRFGVLQVAVALLAGGAIRPVPSEDLVARAEDRLARGEAAAALPLLRRALERGDAPSHTRVRLADALEASGDPVAAAAELDTFASLGEEPQAAEVFEAIQRALKLRDGDPITAARLCDHYLRYRSLLKAKRAEATAALGTLIHGATFAGRPLEAAQRLACFLQNAEAPPDDLAVLGDLYAAGGDRTEAASAYYRRAETLLALGRAAPARDFLRKALDQDSTRTDVRRRLQDLEGQARRRGRKKRITVLLVLLGLLVVGAGGAWWFMTREATQAVRETRDDIEGSLRDAESQVARHVTELKALVVKAEQAEEIPGELGSQAQQMLAAVKKISDDLRTPLAAYAARLDESTGGTTTANETIVRGLDQRRISLVTRAQSAVSDIERRAESLLHDGEAANKKGEFEEARRLIVGARNLGFQDPTVRDRALVLLKHVDGYRAACAAAFHEVEAARDRGDLEAAARRTFAALSDLLDSDLTRRLRVPVALDSRPSGAQVVLGGKATGLTTPCVLTYSPFEDTTVVLRLPGRTSAVIRLPDYAASQKRAAELAAWDPRVKAELPDGPRWRLTSQPGERIVGLWMAGDVPVVLLEDGFTTRTVDPLAGTLGAGVSARLSNPMRLGGTLPGGTEWRILGHRTLRVKHGQGEAWETQAVGRLERPPVVQDGVLVIVDEAGGIYAFQASGGSELWRKSLGAQPSQGPYASKAGVLVATMTGAAYAYDPTRGTSKNLAAAGRGLTLAVPHGDGALLVGAGAGGLRRAAGDGTMTTLGDGMPLVDREAYVGADGVAWATTQGVLWLPVGATAPVPVPGLGAGVARLSGGSGRLFAVDAGGLLRAVDPARPDVTLWSTPLGGAAQAVPVVTADAVFTLVDGGIVAVER